MDENAMVSGVAARGARPGSLGRATHPPTPTAER